LHAALEDQSRSKNNQDISQPKVNRKYVYSFNAQAEAIVAPQDGCACTEQAKMRQKQKQKKTPHLLTSGISEPLSKEKRQ
jgi:hypothetical protein